MTNAVINNSQNSQQDTFFPESILTNLDLRILKIGSKTNEKKNTPGDHNTKFALLNFLNN